MRDLQNKTRKTAVVKGLRSFNTQNDPFVDLELIDFGKAYKELKSIYATKKSDWLNVKKFYLKYQ